MLLLTKAEKTPLLWAVLANRYRDTLRFAAHRDRGGKASAALGFAPGGDKESKVLVLDEATASVDYETDRKVQETIAREFNDRTILCIARTLLRCLGI